MLPDSALVRRCVASPNHGERVGTASPSMLILHYTGMPGGQGALERLADPAAQVSCHYFVGEDGEIIQMVPEARRAWHAGQSNWEGITDINSHSIGIEIVNPGHEWGYRDFPAVQMAAVRALCSDIVSRHAILPQHVLGHSDIAPLRKTDPGERFDWASLAAEGVGLHVPSAPIRGGRFFSPGEAGQPIEALQAMFSLYGYGLPITGVYDELTEAVVSAFQRHFRPERVDGICDASTIETLRDLIARRG
ncbi:N-acetylmuramoyl-L-alanine amidase [Labrys miyagiensis]|uniref:N-acetylmuramoyl-L-alanine amidase n=1 Tax=Labrys miyagiensis TaxID=346912 RepID=A0ABQ6CLS3_9HYPH|nr:N-acetylmuramoyl-L-alanine amidase [Labrys miyagiensis]GLS21253.1 N-acetylmuramoyl-L-alanine amidase [Labrys miyagiensis]